MSMTTRALSPGAAHRAGKWPTCSWTSRRRTRCGLSSTPPGLCHSDDHITKGDARPRFPMVGGHEGAGWWNAVGPDVRRVKPGDRMICSYIPACGHAGRA